MPTGEEKKSDSGAWKIRAGAFEDWSREGGLSIQTRDGKETVSHPWHFSFGSLLDGSGWWA